MLYPQVTEISASGELVFFRDVTAAASMFECLRFAWDEAQLEADLAYEAWRRENGADSFVVYRAAQDRADAAQDVLARGDAQHAVRHRWRPWSR